MRLASRRPLHGRLRGDSRRPARTVRPRLRHAGHLHDHGHGKTVISDVRPLVGLPDDAYDDIVAGEMDYVGVRSGTDEPVYVGQLPGSVEQAYDEYLDMMTDIMSGSGRAVLQDALEAAQWLAYRLSELTQRHLVVERSRTWKLAE